MKKIDGMGGFLPAIQIELPKFCFILGEWTIALVIGQISKVFSSR